MAFFQYLARSASPLALTVGKVFILAACACKSDLYAYLETPGYVPNRAEIIGAVDWETVEVIKIDVRQNKFCAAIVRPLLEKPFILMVEN